MRFLLSLLINLNLLWRSFSLVSHVSCIPCSYELYKLFIVPSCTYTDFSQSSSLITIQVTSDSQRSDVAITFLKQCMRLILSFYSPLKLVPYWNKLTEKCFKWGQRYKSYLEHNLSNLRTLVKCVIDVFKSGCYYNRTQSHYRLLHDYSTVYDLCKTYI